jgi:hypothetical protein
MAAGQIPTEESGGTVPVACSLTSAGLAAQGERWERLAARAMSGRTETTRGLRISFRPEPGAEEELRHLVAVENECCPWAAWTVAKAEGQIVLDVRSTGEGVATLHGLFASLRPDHATGGAPGASKDM